MKLERGVWCEKGAVTKKVVFSSTNIASRKRAFNIDNILKRFIYNGLHLTKSGEER
jgi:hypothetical protein